MTRPAPDPRAALAADLIAAPEPRPLPAVVAFDLDDTLAPSKSPLPPRMAELLGALLDRADVAIISGGAFPQFRTQVVERLAGATPARLARLHLLPTCGTQYYRFVPDAAGSGEWDRLYAETLTPEQSAATLEALETQARRLDLWPAEPWGDVLEDRGSQVTFSALGQQAPVDAKHAWDPTGAKKESLRAAVAPLLPELEVRSGGSTSVDVTRRGIDKAYGMRKLFEVTGLGPDDVVFVGDRLDVGGNDHPVIDTGVPSVAVTGWEQTVELLERWAAA